MGSKPRATLDDRDRPWIFRTYAGHTSARASNELFRNNLKNGQTGLSIAFDLPTQCGYSSSDPIAEAEVGKVGVPINTIDDFHVLFDGIPIETMNTSMTINATSMWLLACYIGLAKERGVELAKLRGTTQNDIVKEYLARGTYVFPPEASFRLISEMYEYCLEEIPNWNPSNTCSYHLQEAGATPVQELAFALANAIEVLDAIKARGNMTTDAFHKCVGRMSFFVNAGMRFVEEMCKMRAFVELWHDITANRYGVTNPKYQRFRYGVQVNSLGLTKQQPENNAWRILIESLGVTLSKKARCRALQLPAWNEALSLPRPWDQQWSLRMQQILALETDLLEYPDLFDGSHVVETKTAELIAKTQEELATIEKLGGVKRAIESGYMKSQLVKSMGTRMASIEDGETPVVGVNVYQNGIDSPLTQGADGGVFKQDKKSAEEAVAALEATKRARDDRKVSAALAELKRCAQSGQSLMEPSIECALARVTTGEWSNALREVFGEYRSATGIAGQSLARGDGFDSLQARARVFLKRHGRRPKMVVAKPGLDGHSNGAEMIAVAARDSGFDVIYPGIRMSPSALAVCVAEESADVLGISLLSGSHLALVGEIQDNLQKLEVSSELSVVVGGIIPAEDFSGLKELGVDEVFTPADYQLTDVMSRVMDVVERKNGF